MSGIRVVVLSVRRDGGRAVHFPAQCAFSKWLICGVRCITAIDFSRRTNKNIEAILKVTRPIVRTPPRRWAV
jgi:hypothetical protein